ncbi:hypothetical protein PSN45_001900 [Yamadazyma tenuis]|uniref:uncharacterized protein n=1 Tax=Candida tenuis TaxID=2315449 RepID=UPI00279D439F|nr:hypothetical protein PSN45_001900 [Yamadazyma tenuis]
MQPTFISSLLALFSFVFVVHAAAIYGRDAIPILKPLRARRSIWEEGTLTRKVEAFSKRDNSTLATTALVGKRENSTLVTRVIAEKRENATDVAIKKRFADLDKELERTRLTY